MRIFRFVWRQPLWLLRCVTALGGWLGGAFILFFSVPVYDAPWPAAEVMLSNQTGEEASVLFNVEPAVLVGSRQSHMFTSERTGSQRIDIFLSGALNVVLEFKAPSYGVDLGLEIVDSAVLQIE